MPYSFYVTDSFGNRVPVNIRPACQKDFEQTVADHWQTNWTSEFIRNREYKKYAMEITLTGELAGLLVYKTLVQDRCLRLFYMEAAPKSNPTLVKPGRRKYYNIGKAFLAFSVAHAMAAGLDGTLSFKAKTTELFYHYRKDFGAIPLGYAPFELLLLAEDGRTLLEEYYMEEVSEDE